MNGLRFCIRKLPYDLSGRYWAHVPRTCCPPLHFVLFYHHQFQSSCSRILTLIPSVVAFLPRRKFMLQFRSHSDSARLRRLRSNRSQHKLILACCLLLFSHLSHTDGDLSWSIVDVHSKRKQPILKRKPISQTLQRQFVNILIEPTHALKNGLQLLREILLCKFLNVKQVVAMVGLESKPENAGSERSDESWGMDLNAYGWILLHR